MRRVIGKAALVLGGLIGGLAVVLLAAFGVAQTDYGRHHTARLLEGMLAGPGETVRIGGLDGTLPLQVRARDIELADGRGVWLAIDELRLDWAMAELLRGRVRVRELALAGGRFERPSEAKDDGEPMSPPRFDLVVDRLTVDGLVVGEALAGEPATIDIAGAAAFVGGGRSARLDLSVERRDGPGGHLWARLAHAQAPPMFALDVDLAEPTGGLIARLAGLAGAPALSLRASGEGPPAAWRGNIAAEVEGRGRFAGGLDVAVGDDTRMRLTGEAGLANVEPVVRRLVGDKVPIAVTARWRPGRSVEIEHARIGADRLEAGGSGSLDLRNLRLDAKLGVVVRDVAADPAAGIPAAVERLSAEAVAAGPVASPSIELKLTGSSVAAQDFAAETVLANVRVQPAGDPVGSMKFSGSGSIDGAQSRIAALAPLLRERVSWSLAGHRLPSGEVALASFAVDAGPARLRSSATLDATGSGIAGTVELAASDVAALLPPGSASLAGPATIAAEFRVEAGGAAAADIRASASPRTDDAAIAAVVGERLDLAARIERDAAGTVRVGVPRIALAAGSAKLDGTARDDFARIEATFAVSVPDLAAMTALAGVDLGGAAGIEGAVRGPMENLAGEAKLTARNLAVGARRIDRLTATLDGTRRAEEMDGKVALDLEHGRDAVRLRSLLKATDAAVEARNLSLVHGESRLAGSLVMRRADGRLQGKLTGGVGDLATLAQLTGVPASGSIQVRVELTGRDVQQASVNVAARDLRLDGEDAATVESADVSLQARWREEPRAMTAQARAAVTGAGAGDLGLRTVALTASGGLADMRLSGSVSGDAPQRFDLGFAGTAALAGDDIRFALTRLDGALGELDSGPAKFALARPATLTLGPGGASLTTVDLSVGSGRIRVGGRVQRERLEGEVDVASFPLRLVRLVAPNIDLDGTLAMEARLRGTRARPEARLDLSLSEVRPAGGTATRIDAAATPRLSGKLQATLDAAQLAVDGRLAGGDAAELTFEGRIPTVLDPETMVPSLATDHAIAARAAGHADAARLMEMVGGADGDRIAGRIVLDLTAEGMAGAPRVGGAIAFENGSYESAMAGTVVRNLTARIAAEPESLRLVALTGDDGDGGRLEANGRFDARPDRRFPFELSVRLAQFRALRRDEGTAQLSGPIVVSGDADRVSVRGAIDVEGAEFFIPERLPAGVVKIEVEETGPRPANGAARAERKLAGGPAVDLDVWVRIVERVFVRGRGLTSDWKGAINVRGSAEEPVIKGKVELNRGTLAFAGKTFSLTRGLIEFPGGKEPDPDLDIVAELKLRDALAVMAVSGKGSAPKIELRSDPPLPSEEVLSRILFGKSAGELSAVQAVQLADSMATLSGVQSSRGVFDRLRTAAGLDVLTVEGNTDGKGGGKSGADGTSLKAGKYVSENVFVTVGQGKEPGSSKVGVEIEVTRNISVDTHLGGDAQGNVGISWKWDY